MDFCQSSVILHSSRTIKTLKKAAFVWWSAREPRVWMYGLKVKNEMKDGWRKLFIKLAERSLEAATVYQAAPRTR